MAQSTGDNAGERRDRLAGDIRRQFGERSTSRFLHALPAFRVVEDIPAHLRMLLDKLERTEGGKAKASR